MRIIARIKDRGSLCGYVVEHNTTRVFVNLQEIGTLKPSNAIRLKDGTFKAKNGHSIETKDINDIHNLGIIIQNRNTSLIGKPSLIYNTSFGKLSNTQKRILEALNEMNICKFEKARDNISIDMKDLSSLTAYTGIEYSLFRRGDSYVVAKGNERGMYISTQDAAKLISNRYTWVGHTHPGNTQLCMMPSDSDYDTLQRFNQKRSTIYNSVGNYYVFELEE